jgi:hypothetical protein
MTRVCQRQLRISITETDNIRRNTSFVRVKARQLRSGAATLPWRDGTIEGRGSQGKKADWRRSNRVRAFFFWGKPDCCIAFSGCPHYPASSASVPDISVCRELFCCCSTFFVAFPILNSNMFLVCDVLIVLMCCYRIIATSEYAKVIG